MGNILYQKKKCNKTREEGIVLKSHLMTRKRLTFLTRESCLNTGTPLGVSEAKFKTILQLTLSVKGLGLFLKNFRAFSVTSSWYFCFHAVVILCLLLRSRLLIVRVMTMKFAQLSLTHIDTGTTIGGECGKICIFSSINTHCTMLCHTTPHHTTPHHTTSHHTI